MELSQIPSNSYSLINLAREINKEELYEFAIKYLEKHCWINTKKLS